MSKSYNPLKIKIKPGAEFKGHQAGTDQVSIPKADPQPSMVGIPEEQAVQEYAFRAGQADHGVDREVLPASLFAAEYDELWLEFYVLGRTSRFQPATTAKAATTSPAPAGLQNFTFTPFINPWTQSLEKPEGTVDIEWVRRQCQASLNCMAALIGKVCKRQPGWKRLACDVPEPAKKVIMAMSDLRAQYEALQEDAKVALAGGHPSGY